MFLTVAAVYDRRLSSTVQHRRQRAAINKREKYDGHTQRNSQGARADRRRACRNPEVIRAGYETRSLAVMGEGRMGRVAVGLSVLVAMTRPANRKEARTND